MRNGTDETNERWDDRSMGRVRDEGDLRPDFEASGCRDFLR
jgi:hypothetical protein